MQQEPPSSSTRHRPSASRRAPSVRRFDRRFARMDDIERKLAQTPSGLSITSLARIYQVDRSTIYRDIGALEERGTGLIQDGRRWKLDHRRMLFSTHFTPHELVCLYLASRLLVRYSDERNPHVTTALEKLADSLHNHSPLVTRHITQSAEVASARPPNPEYVNTFEVLTQAWLLARKAHIVYQGFNDEHPRERLFSPYVIEPSGIGFSLYAIGYDDLRQDIRTLKLDRIHSAHLTDESFSLPTNFDPFRQLANAWGIIWNQDGQEEVRLRFSPRVSRRVKESVWHPSQRLEDLPDGSCLFTVHLGSLTEIKPWIRQWGADVEAIAPQSLRDDLAAEAHALAAMYSSTGG